MISLETVVNKVWIKAVGFLCQSCGEGMVPVADTCLCGEQNNAEYQNDCFFYMVFSFVFFLEPALCVTLKESIG